MPAPTRPLNNVRLHETDLPSAHYNRLPHIDNVKDAATDNARAHAILFGVIARHGLADTFSLRLVHKHFDIPEGRIMVYEKISGYKYKDSALCSPRILHKCPGARGLYFRAAPGGNMVAYEYTTEPGTDLSAHEDFVAEFASAALENGVQDVFSLAALPTCPQYKVLTQFGIAQVQSMVLVPDAWLPLTQYIASSTSTDWVATADCANEHHISVTYSGTQTGKHLGHAPDLFSGETPPMDQVLTINGQVLREGTGPHAIICRALQLVEAV